MATQSVEDNALHRSLFPEIVPFFAVVSTQQSLKREKETEYALILERERE